MTHDANFFMACESQCQELIAWLICCRNMKQGNKQSYSLEQSTRKEFFSVDNTIGGLGRDLNTIMQTIHGRNIGSLVSTHFSLSTLSSYSFSLRFDLGLPCFLFFLFTSYLCCDSCFAVWVALHPAPYVLSGTGLEQLCVHSMHRDI